MTQPSLTPELGADWRRSIARLGEKAPWLWAGLGAIALWITIRGVSGGGMIGTMRATLGIGSFLVLVGLGQLLVIATGDGNIDLSIPSVMTLSSLTALTVAEGADSRIFVGIAAGVGAGLVIGLVNVIMIFFMRIPAIVATLASGLCAQSVILESRDALAAPTALKNFSTAELLGLPSMTWVAAGISVFAAFYLQRGLFGRRVFALGQSSSGTLRTGLPTSLTAAICYMISATLASVSGILLASTTGPTLTLGTPFLLTSVAVVVLGGSLISGGRATVAGLWTATVMLSLIVSLVTVLKWSTSIRDIFQGLVIIGVLTLAGGTQRDS